MGGILGVWTITFMVLISLYKCCRAPQFHLEVIKFKFLNPKFLTPIYKP